VRATGVGADTTLTRIIRKVEEAQEEKAPTQRFIERFARWYTPAIILLSGIVYLISRDIELALTLLVIACPGALVISTPVSVVAGIGRAAKAGILIKGGEYLENAGKISAVALDKTGTLTQGKPKVSDVIAFEQLVTAGLAPAHLSTAGSERPGTVTLPGTNGNRPSEGWSEAQRHVLYWAALAEAGSEHPLARAISAEGKALFGGSIPQVEAFEMLTGLGVHAEAAGHQVGVGNRELVEDLGVHLDSEEEAHLARLKDDGKTAVLVALDGRLLGILGIADPIRETSAQMVRKLKETGIRDVVMLTGDDRRTAETIARGAGIDTVYAGLLPEEKLSIIHQYQRAGRVVAMTGDGINDAPALAAADIGIAMGAAGSDVAVETADIALMADDLLKIPEAIRLSKRTLWNIRQNVFLALLTVAVLLSGVLLGKVHMAGGMLIHELSVLVVILNGMRLLRA
jgi:Cd2+/Zn2+-exporting ATPase